MTCRSAPCPHRPRGWPPTCGLGQGGGHDLNYRTLQAMGVQLLGRLTGLEGYRARFADDLADSVASARSVRRHPAAPHRQLGTARTPVPELPAPSPFRATAPPSLDLRDFAAVIFTSGYRPNYATG